MLKQCENNTRFKPCLLCTYICILHTKKN